MGNLAVQALELAIPVAVLAEREHELLKEALGVLGNLDHLAEARRVSIPQGHNTVALRGLAGRGGRNLGQLNGLVDQVDTGAGSANGLEVTERLTHVVQGATILGQRRDRLVAAGNEDGVEHGAALALEVVVGDDAGAGGAVLAGGVDGRAARRNDEGKGLGGLQGAVHGVEGDGVVAVGDNDGDAARHDGRLLRQEVKLAQVLGLLAVDLPARAAGLVAAHHLGDGLGEVHVDLSDALDHALVDDGLVAVVQLEGQGVHQVRLLNLGERVEEELGLVDVLLELGAPGALLDALHLGGELDKTALGLGGRGLLLEAVGPVVHLALGDGVAALAVAVEVHDGADGLVDGQLLPVDAQTGQLSVEIGEVSALQERIVGEADAGDDVARAEGDLLGLGEELIDVAVELELSDVSNGDDVLGPDLGGVENVKVELVLAGLGQNLDTKLPLGVGAVLNGLHEVLAVEVGVLAGQLEGLVPDERVDAQLRGEVKLDKGALALCVDEGEGVDAEALHHAVRAGDGAVRHGPHEHVRRLRVHELEVPEVVVRRLGLGHLVVRLGLAGVDDVRELHGVLDEEDGDVVADEVPVALLGVELDGEAAHVADRVGGPAAAEDGGEAHEDGRLAGRVGQDAGRGDVLGGLEEGELAKGAGAAGVDDSLWDALVVEAVDLGMRLPDGLDRTQGVSQYLLTAKVVLQQRRSELVLPVHAQPVVGVGLLHAKVGCDAGVLGRLDHVGLQLVLLGGSTAAEGLLDGLGYYRRHCDIGL
ncbi:LOW QUALITY PROTEIN: putative two component histidine kinase [Paramyrothecium foliicola]|nr:LOW QUALITY PROTEIN: putative two component histidine kinase [Paramyrothecium foliicola]